MIRSIFVALLLLNALSAAEPEWRWQPDLAPDPGFDLDAAQVLKVTTLDPWGDGSLGEALRTKGPRLIVFEVGGVIDLNGKGLSLKEPDVYVAGQTAPEPGITLIRGGLSVESDRTVLQHIRVRPGDNGQAKKSGWEPDGITTSGGPGDVWIDHCSVTWSVDEGISASTYESPDGRPARRIFIRDCIIAEGLCNSSHAKGEHSKGTLVFDGTQHVAITGCLYASNTERNPLFKADTSGVVVNCVIAGAGQRSIHGGGIPDQPGPHALAKIAVAGNVVLFGRHTKRSSAIFEGEADGYFANNEGYDWFGKPLPVLRKPFETLPAPPVWPQGLEAASPAAAMWRVTRFAGARPALRDAIDSRIVAQAMTGQSRMIDSQEEVGGYPDLKATSRAQDVPDTGRREWLETLAREVTLGEDSE